MEFYQTPFETYSFDNKNFAMAYTITYFLSTYHYGKL